MREWKLLQGSSLRNGMVFLWRHRRQGERGLRQVGHRKRYREAGGVGNARVDWGPCV